MAVSGGFNRSEAQISRLTSGFHSDASRYVWNAGAEFDHRQDNWAITFSNRFRSEAFLLSRQVNEFRDENYTTARLTHQLGEGLSAVGFGDGRWFSQNSSSTVEGYGGVLYVPRPFLTLEPAGGLVVDRKPGLLLEGQIEPEVLVDAGPGVSLTAGLANVDVGGFDVEASTRNRWHFISPRFGRSLNAIATVSRAFDRGSFRAGLHGGDLVRQSYQASSFLNRLEDVDRADDTIESSRSDTVGADLEVEYTLGRGWRALATGSVITNRRFVRTLRAPADELFFDTNFSRDVADVQGIVAYNGRRSTFQLTATRQITIERRRLDNEAELPPGQAAQKSLVLRQTDFDRGIFWVRLTGRHSFNRWLAVRGSYRASILRHDTPVVNLDDRDESAFDADLGLVIRFHRTLEADVRVFGVRHHTVYLDGSRSSENHERRSLRLVPGMRWRPDRQTDLRLESEVRAVYTTDDFTFSDQPTNDQSARELKYSGAFSRDIGEGASIALDGSYSRLLLGRLLWSDFEEIPFDTLATTTGWARLEVGKRWRAEIGIRVFFRTEYERSLSVRYSPSGSEGTLETISRPGRKRLLQIGPTCAVVLPLSKESELRMSGWVQFQQTRLSLYGELPPDDAERIIEAGRQAERRTIPNLTISILWNL